MEHPYAIIQKVLTNQFATLRMRTTLRGKSRSRIAMFHDICEDNAVPADEYACSLQTLIACVDRHLDFGFSFVPLDKFLSLPQRQAKYGCCVLTFDDGYTSIDSIVAPYLFAREIPFTIYLITGQIGQPGYLTQTQIRSLAENPLCTIGSHSVSHSMMRFQGKTAVDYELLESRRVLEQIIGKPVQHFAFPYGSAYACSSRNLYQCKLAGYTSAMLTTPTVYSRFPYGHFSLPRLNLPQL
ncbi:MAG: polysaccharide deacetylase family protein [Clostridia bacterium]